MKYILYLPKIVVPNAVVLAAVAVILFVHVSKSIGWKNSVIQLSFIRGRSPRQAGTSDHERAHARTNRNAVKPENNLNHNNTNPLLR